VKRASFAPLLLALGCVPDDRPPTPRATTEAATQLATPTPLQRRQPVSIVGVPFIPTASSRPVGSNAPAPPALGAPPSADPPLTRAFTDNFDRAMLGPEWTATTGAWRLEGGRLCVEHAKNHPVWLRRRLPVNARIEFDVTSSSEEGDIKAEYWGDGHSAAETVSYNAATSYLTIFGGWKNHFHVLARVDEHAPNRPELRVDSTSDDPRARPVAAGRSYHFKVIRDDGRTVRWSVDDLEILSYPDPEPLTGAGHDHFGFNDWDVRLCFDNLAVSPLP
jgi:hypothetical protein